MSMSWVPFAMILPIFAAAMPLINEYTKANPVYLVIFYRIVSIFLFLPVVFFAPLPTDPYFYLFVSLAGLIALYFDTMFFSSASTAGAGVTSRVMPFVVLGGFVLWLFVRPSLFFEYLESPLKSTGILTAFVMASYFALRLKSCPVSRRTIRLLLPAIILGSFVVVLGKLAMEHAGPTHGPFYYVLVQSILILPIYVIAVNLKPLKRFLPQGYETRFFSKSMVIAGLSMAMAWSGLMVVKYYGYSLAVNPAYVSLFELMSPVLISGFYILQKQKEEADVLSGYGIICSVLLLVLCTEIL